MAMLVTYPDGLTEVIKKATRVDGQNFHEGMYDFYDESGLVLLRQIKGRAFADGSVRFSDMMDGSVRTVTSTSNTQITDGTSNTK